MSRILLLGDPVLTLEPGAPRLERGAVVVEGDRIVDVGPQDRFSDPAGFDAVLGSNDRLLMPGLFNCHYHGETVFGPGLYDVVWEKAGIWFHESLGDVDEDDLQALLLWALLRQVRSGTTGVIDFFYGRPGLHLVGAEATLRAYRDSGLRAALALAVRDQNRYVHADDEWVLAQLPAEDAKAVRASPVGYAHPVETVLGTFERLFDQHHRERGRTHVMLAPDWTPSCSDALLMRTKRLAAERGTELQIHLLETRYELLWNLRTHGRSAVRRLYDLGFLGPEVTGAHCVWLTDEDIALLAETGVIVSHNPGSNLRLTSGIAPVRELLGAGVRVAIGTDGISANDDDDLFEETRLAGLLQRVRGSDPGRILSETLLRGACASGAAAAGWSDVGTIRPGGQADLILLDKADLGWPPERFSWADPHDLVLDRASARHVVTSVIAGVVVMEERVLRGVDEEALRRKAEEAAERIYRVPPELEALRPSVERLEAVVRALCAEWDREPLPPGLSR